MGASDRDGKIRALEKQVKMLGKEADWLANQLVLKVGATSSDWREAARNAVAGGGRMSRDEGRTWMHNSKKWHYFRNKKSLCGKYMLLVAPTDGYEDDMDSPDNCAICVQKRTISRQPSKR